MAAGVSARNDGVSKDTLALITGTPRGNEAGGGLGGMPVSPTTITIEAIEARQSVSDALSASLAASLAATSDDVNDMVRVGTDAGVVDTGDRKKPGRPRKTKMDTPASFHG